MPEVGRMKHQPRASGIMPSPRTILRRLVSDCRGGMALMFSLALIPLLGCIALAVDVSTWHSARSELQKIADGAAIVSARELRVGAATPEVLQEAARLYAQTMIATGTSFIVDPEIRAEISAQRDSVTVAVTSTVSPIFSSLFNTGLSSVEVQATALLAGREPVCMISTDPHNAQAMALLNNARIDAEDCGIYVNSRAGNALRLDANSRLDASLICVHGGVAASSSQITPAPLTGCPQINDPLTHRAAALANEAICRFEVEATRIAGMAVVYPGTYCGGIEIPSSANVVFQPGTYHIGGVGLRVTGGARIRAHDVTFVFHGGADAYFGPDSTLELSARREGNLAGMLFIEAGAGGGGTFRISSNNARTLLGTIYLPKSRFLVDADQPVARDSAYTVVVAREIMVSNHSRLVLNTDYAATDVPVPEGVGPHSEIILSQ